MINPVEIQIFLIYEELTSSLEEENIFWDTCLTRNLSEKPSLLGADIQYKQQVKS